MKKQLFVSALVLALLSSCSERIYYQVYQLESSDVQQKGNVLFFENDDCTITYNLWANGGDLSFLMHNKTSENMFVVMPQSFFILNGIANNYYSETTYGRTVTGIAALSASRQMTLSGYLTNGLSWYPSTLSRQVGAMAGVSTSKSVQTKEPAYICIPPKSSKFIMGFNISDYVYKDCENYDQNYPKVTSNIVRYSQANSPLVLRNRVAYTLSKEDGEARYIDHNFWLSSVQNYAYKSAFSKEKVKVCETDMRENEKRFVMSSPQRFYNVYKRNPFADTSLGHKSSKKKN